MTTDGRNRTTKSRKNQNAWRKGNLLILKDIGSGHHQTNEDEKEKKRISQKNEKTTRNKTILQKSHKRDKHLSSW